jgi:hypothetical protein
MKNLIIFGAITLLIVAILILSACESALAPGGMQCKGGFCVRVQIEHPIRFNEPVTVNIGFRTTEDVPRLRVSLQASHPSVRIEGRREWSIDTRAQQDMTLSTTVRFTEEGTFEIFATVHAPSLGVPVTDSQYVRITRAGGEAGVTPERKQGTPFLVPSVATLSPQPTPSRTATPVPTPTRAPYP